MKGATRRKLSRTFSLFSCLAVLTLASCSTAPHDPYLSREPYSAPAPNWQSMSLSWSKLDRIQTWIDSSGPRRWPNAVPGAELELAQGRLSLATREAGQMNASIITARLDRAEAGFKRVLAGSNASSIQRREANLGLTQVRSQRSAPKTPGTSNIILRSAWGAAPVNLVSLTKNRKAWRRITIHHTAMDSSAKDLGSSALAIRKIQKEHLSRAVAPGSSQTWGDIGYHFLIDSSGRIFQGRSLNWKGAHAGGSSANAANIGICLLGNFTSHMPTPQAMASMEKLVRDLSKRHGIGQSSLRGHLEFKATECPGALLMAWVRRYASRG